MINRTPTLALALLLALTLTVPAISRQITPIPAPTGSPTTDVPIPSRATRLVPPATPEPGPSDQPGLFASDPRLLARDRTGPFLRGDEGRLAVVGVYPDDSGNDVLVGLRNNTSGDVRGAEITATLHDAATDAPIALGITSDIAPAIIAPGGLAFAMVTLDGAASRLSDDDLPHIDVRVADRNSQASPSGVRVVSATVSVSDVLAAVAIDSGSATAFQMTVVCVRQAGPHALAVSGWSSSVTLYEAQLRPGDTETLRASPPLHCGGRFIVAVASY